MRGVSPPPTHPVCTGHWMDGLTTVVPSTGPAEASGYCAGLALHTPTRPPTGSGDPLFFVPWLTATVTIMTTTAPTTAQKR